MSSYCLKYKKQQQQQQQKIENRNPRVAKANNGKTISLAWSISTLLIIKMCYIMQ